MDDVDLCLIEQAVNALATRNLMYSPAGRQEAALAMLEVVIPLIREQALREVAKAANGPELPNDDGDWLDGAVAVIEFIEARADQEAKKSAG